MVHFSGSKLKYAGILCAALIGSAVLGSAYAPVAIEDVLEQGAAHEINWTTLTLRADISFAWQPLAVTAGEKRAEANAIARNMALSDLQKVLLSLPIDSSTFVRDLMAHDESGFSYEVQNFVPELARIALPFHSSGNRVRMGMEIDLLGQAGFLSMLSNHFPMYVRPPEPRSQTRAAFHHSGVIIDARHLDFHPALGTRVFNTSGDMVYGIPHTDRTVYVKEGHILFLRDHTDPRAMARTGVLPILVLAKDVRGPANTDLILFDADSDRILASNITRTHLRRCSVVVLCNSIQK